MRAKAAERSRWLQSELASPTCKLLARTLLRQCFNMKNIAHILVPLDFSPHSTAALSFASDLARRYEASLHLLHVFKVVMYALPDGYTIPSPEQIGLISDELEAKLRTAKHDALATGVQHVDTTLLQGDPAVTIERVAREGHYDLIVMGTHGRGGVKHLLIGSVAEKTVRHAPCPVLTIRAADAV